MKSLIVREIDGCGYISFDKESNINEKYPEFKILIEGAYDIKLLDMADANNRKQIMILAVVEE